MDQAVDLANASDYGLSIGILGGVGLAMEVAGRISSGKIHINEHTVSDEAHAPFGGVGASGTSSRFGVETADIEAFTETQWLTVRPGIADYPFQAPRSSIGTGSEHDDGARFGTMGARS